MKAIVQTAYGSPEVLELRDIEPPAIGDHGVLVKVQGASVNALDWHMTRGMPYLLRLSEGMRAPKHSVRGVDVAGRVVAIGNKVTQVRIGDDVFGGSDGSFAEHAGTTEDRVTHKPSELAYEQAAGLYVAGMTAIQGLREKAQLAPGQRVLINGAGGGVGTMAVQVARWLGAHVTAVTRTESVEMVRSIGADVVIDHRTEDFTRSHERYDVLFDIGGNRSLTNCRRVLAADGIFVAVGGPAGRWLAPATRMLKAATFSPFVKQRFVPFISRNDRATLALLADLAQTGQVRAVIDRQFSLSDTPEAIRYVGTGRARGKVVILA